MEVVKEGGHVRATISRHISDHLQRSDLSGRDSVALLCPQDRGHAVLSAFEQTVVFIPRSMSDHNRSEFEIKSRNLGDRWFVQNGWFVLKPCGVDRRSAPNDRKHKHKHPTDRLKAVVVTKELPVSPTATATKVTRESPTAPQKKISFTRNGIRVISPESACVQFPRSNSHTPICSRSITRYAPFRWNCK